MLLSELAVVLGMAVLPFYRFSTELSLDRCRRAHHQGAGWHIFGHHSPSSHQGSGPHSHAIENDGADADKAAVVEGGAMDDGPVADGHIAANQHRIIRERLQALEDDLSPPEGWTPETLKEFMKGASNRDLDSFLKSLRAVAGKEKPRHGGQGSS